VLAATGFLDPGDVGPIGVRASRLGSHPDRDLVRRARRSGIPSRLAEL
jgi:hypothetical protein